MLKKTLPCYDMLPKLLTLSLIVSFLFSFSPLFANFSSHLDIIVTVKDAQTNEPLIGVSVFTEDNSFVAFTDVEGKVNLGTLSHRQIVHFSYVGYTPQELAFYELRQQPEVLLFAASTLVDSIVVVGRRDDPVEEIPYVVERISQEEIAFKNTQTPADALAASADVYVQKSQMGGGSPIIRGFEANKILLVLDGVRMNNAIYRSGHLQNSITIDNAILDQAEVIFGPGSLMYGSDALGGVVHFRTRDPKVLFDLSEGYSKMKVGAYTRFASANLEKSIHLDLDYRSDRWGTMTSLTYNNYGDLRVGANRPTEFPNMGTRPFSQFRVEEEDKVRGWNNQNIMRSTGYNQFDLLQKVKFQPSETLYFVANLQYSTSSNVPRFDNLTDTISTASDLKWAEWYYGPQKRLLTSMKARMLKSNFLYDKGTVIAAFQKIEEDRLKRKFAGAQRTFNTEDVYVYSATADFDKYLNENQNHVFSYGFDGAHNKVLSEAGKIRMSNGRVSRGAVFTRYPSDYSTMSSYGAYANYKLSSKDSVFVFNAGLRYSLVNLFAKYAEDDLDLIAWPQEYTTTGVKVSNNDLTWGTGITLNTKNNFQVRGLVSTAFRSPNIDDFAKLRVKNQYAVLPNTALKPERSIGGELTIGKQFGRENKGQGMAVHISGTGFYTHLKDAIVRRLGVQPNGDSTIYVESEPSPLFIVQQNVNDNYAKVMGFSGNIEIKIQERWRLKGSYNYTQGRSQTIIKLPNSTSQMDTLLAMAHIPPTYGRVGLLYKGGRFKAEGVLRFSGSKPLEEYAVTSVTVKENKQLEFHYGGSSDNPESTPFRVAEDGSIEHVGSLAWTTLNFYSSFEISKSFTVDFALENILDKHYLPFSSGISAPGRNFILTLRTRF